MALLPDFEMVAGKGSDDGELREVDRYDIGRWSKIKVIDGLAKNRHSAHTATQTKWEVGVF